MAALPSAVCAASSNDAPLPIASAAAHAQHEIPKLAVPVSTSRTGTSTVSDASRAELSVPLIASAMCTDKISVAPRSTSRRICLDERSRRRLARGDLGSVVIGPCRVEAVGIEVDAFEVIDTVDRHRQRDDFDSVALREFDGELTVRIDDDSDHDAGSVSVGLGAVAFERPAARNRSTMIALDSSALTGNMTVGFGPHRLRHPLAHQTTPPTTQKPLDTSVAANARCFHAGTAAVAAATPTSIGK